MTDRDLLELLVEKMDSMEREIVGIKTEMQGINDKITKLDNKITNIEYRQNIIYEQTAFFTEYRTENENKILDLSQKVENNFVDIQVIKKAVAAK